MSFDSGIVAPSGSPAADVWPTSDQDFTASESLARLGPESRGKAYRYAGAEELLAVYDCYKNWHGYLATVVCVLGIVANVLNIVVLTRKNMISSTNCILSGLAVSDGLTMVVYLPFAFRFYVLYGTDSTPERNSLPAIRFMLFYACFSVVVHTVSIWLTVVLAVFRYIFVKYPKYGAEWCSLHRAKIAVILVYLVTFIVCIPNFVTITMKGISVDDDDDDDDDERSSSNSSAAIWLVTFKAATDLDHAIKNLNFWIQAILVKLVPCTGLTILSILLVHLMKDAEARHKKLGANKAKMAAIRNGGRDKKTNRTTRMLLIVVVLFLLTEFPQGILNLLSGILVTDFIDEVYVPLGDILDIVTLINNGINFILYCAMSKQFRDTFIQVFCGPCTRKQSGATRTLVSRL